MINHILYSSSSSEDEEPPIRQRRKKFCPRINFDFQYASEFYQSFRISPTKAESILNTIGNALSHPTGKSGALTAKQQLCVALHWLGSGTQYHVIGRVHGVHESTVCRALKRVVQAVNAHLFHNAVAWPENFAEEMNQFHNLAGFPNVIGVIDGSLIPIDAPNHNENAYVGRKSGHALNAMFVCGASHKFYYVNANWPGSVHDARILRRSNLYRRMEQENFFPNAILLGDSAYPLKTWLMTPLHRDPRSEQERRYNRRHKSTRRSIECALGILKEKFPCLNYLRQDPVFAANIIKCCAALCNIARQGAEQEDIYVPNGDIIEDEDENDVTIEQPHPAAIVRQRQIIEQM